MQWKMRSSVVAMGNERISTTLLCLGKCIIQLIRQHQVIFGGFNNMSTFIICRIAQANRRYITQAARLFQVYEVQNFSNVWKTVNEKRYLKKTEVFHSSTQCVYSIGPSIYVHLTMVTHTGPVVAIFPLGENHCATRW